MNLSKFPKDILYTLALELDISEISNYCSLSKRFNDAVCNNYSFWVNKLRKDYGFTYTGEKTLEGVKNYYKKIKNMRVIERFCEAAFIGDIELVDYLSLKVMNWNFGLYCAAKGGNKDMVDHLIQNGANDWNWAMYGAVNGNNEELVNFFVSKGANDWNEGLSEAMSNGNKELVEYFINKGADEWVHSDEVYRMYPELIEYISDRGVDIDIIM